jgi:hypothetical protein
MNARSLRARLVIVSTLALMLVSFAGVIRAAEVSSSETRRVAHFDHVTTDGTFGVTIEAGAPVTRVTVSGDPADLARVTTIVTDGTLAIKTTDGPPSHAKITVAIQLPNLRGFENNGAGSIDIRGLTGGDVAIANSGAASIVAAGRTDRETVTNDGVGKIDATALDARDVTVDNNGVGSVRVRASGQLTATVNGVGEIRYAGKPAKVQSQVNGVGRIGQL